MRMQEVISPREVMDRFISRPEESLSLLSIVHRVRRQQLVEAIAHAPKGATFTLAIRAITFREFMGRLKHRGGPPPPSSHLPAT